MGRHSVPQVLGRGTAVDGVRSADSIVGPAIALCYIGGRVPAYFASNVWITRTSVRSTEGATCDARGPVS